MAGIAENDQRYYAVTSAAELLKGLIEGKTVSIVEVQEKTSEITYKEGIASEPKEETSDPQTYIVPNKTATEIDEDTDYNTLDDSSSDSIPVDAARNISEETPLTKRKLELTSTASEDLGVTIEEDLDENGNLTLTIYNTKNSKGEDSSPGERYTLKLVFGVDKTETTNTKTKDESSTAVDDSSYTVKTTSTETNITTLTWNLTGINTTP